MSLPNLPPTFESTRAALQRVAAHILGRRRHAVAGRYGLRATPGGFGTPAFGDAVEVLRVAGGWLLHERDGNVTPTALVDASLADLAAVVGVDLFSDFSVGHDTPPVGHDTPPVGDAAALLGIDARASAVLGTWFDFGWQALDGAVAGVGLEGRPTAVQLWPEHFDAGCAVAWNPATEDARVNLGASPGDGHSAEPYLYVGPWGPERPGNDGFWNAPFGATLDYRALQAEFDPLGAATWFLLEGVGRLSKGE